MIPSWKMLRWRKIQDLSFYECGATPDSRFAFVFAGSGKSHVHVLAGQSTLISAERLMARGQSQGGAAIARGGCRKALHCRGHASVSTVPFRWPPVPSISQFALLPGGCQH
jgi:hypothetical protein